MSLKRKLERQNQREVEKQKKRIEGFMNQREMNARLAGVDEAVRYFEDRLHNDVRKIRGIGPKLFKEICEALGFEEVQDGKK